MIRAVIFDMDGLLIDSEPLWQEAEKGVFRSVGLHLTTEMCLETVGIRVDEVVRYRFERNPWRGKTLKEVEEEILTVMERLIAEKGEAMPGVDYILDFFQTRGMRLALASSSYLRIIEATLKALDLTTVFEVIHSAEHEKRGKPAPDIYLSTLSLLELVSDEAIAFEDSVNGMKAAKAAGLKTVCVPEPQLRDLADFADADLKIRSLSEFSEKHLSLLVNSE